MRLHLPPSVWHSIFETVDRYALNPEVARRALDLKEATFYRKRRQFFNGGIPPRKPGSGRRRIYDPKDYEVVIRDILKEQPPIAGHRRIWIKLKKKGVPFCRGTAYRIMRELGLLAPRQAGTSPKRFIPIHPESPREVWFGDTTTYWLGRERFEIYGSIDAYSKYVPCLMASYDKTSDATVKYYERALQNDLPKTMHTDNGGEFANRNAIAYLSERNVDWEHGPKHTPEAQGVIERLFNTLKHEWLDWKEPKSITDLQNRLDEFVVWYNTQREHSSLEYNYPKVVHDGNT